MLSHLIASVPLVLQIAAGRTRDSVTQADIQRAYSALIRIEIVAPPGSNDSMVLLRVDTAPPNSLLASFVHDHELWFWYLIVNGRSFALPDIDGISPGVAIAKRGHSTPVVLRDEFVRQLRDDAQFNALMLPAIATHLRRLGTPVVAGIRTPSPTVLPVDSAMPVAVRFFYPNLIVEGKILTHICTVLNAVRELPTRNYALEALAFAAIMGQVTRGDSSLLEPDLEPALALIRAVDAPGSDQIRLNRAQGVMWGSMTRSSRLREVLLAEARRQQDVLPFELRP